MKLQSAMEYLTTYGWAILIIAIILVAFFALGVFNSNAYSPKAQPGSCSITRNQYGGASESGVCTNEIPQFVAQLSGTANVVIPDSIGGTNGNPTNTITYTAWIETTSASAEAVVESGVHSGFLIDRSGQVFLHECDHGDTGVTVNNNNLNSGTWQFVAIVYSYGSLTGYVDGSSAQTSTSLYGVSPIPQPIISNVATIGYDQCDNSEYFTGFLSNIQVYDTALSQADIESLYQEGIGGPPINLQSIVGWWPLNGNANDYSGYGNDGTSYGIAYSSNWYGSYSAP